MMESNGFIFRRRICSRSAVGFTWLGTRTTRRTQKRETGRFLGRCGDVGSGDGTALWRSGCLGVRGPATAGLGCGTRERPFARPRGRDSSRECSRFLRDRVSEGSASRVTSRERRALAERGCSA